MKAAVDDEWKASKPCRQSTVFSCAYSFQQVSKEQNTAR